MNIKCISLCAAFSLLLVLSCERVVLETPPQQSLLPLAVGNHWDYVDSFFTSTTIPSSDTLVTSISYWVQDRHLNDRQVTTESGEKKVMRTEGWLLLSTVSNNGREAIIAIGENLHTANQRDWSWDFHGTDGNGLTASFDAPAQEVATYAGGFRLTLPTQLKPHEPVVVFPVFFDFPIMIDSLGPLGVKRVYYHIDIPALEMAGLPRMVVAPAGSFLCVDLGWQRWADGVGMVESELEGDTEFLDTLRQPQMGHVRWKRSLLSYQLE